MRSFRKESQQASGFPFQKITIFYILTYLNLISIILENKEILYFGLPEGRTLLPYKDFRYNLY